MMERLHEMLPLIERVAKDVHFTHGLDQEEAVSLLTVEVAEHLRNYLILLDEGHTSLIELRLSNVARVYARAERVKRIAETDQYHYDPEYVRLFLPFFFSYDDWTNGPLPEDVCSEWTTGEAIDTASDIKDAYPSLREWQQRAILARHVACRPEISGGVDWEAIAEAIGRKNGASARDAYASATRELATQMNTARARRIREHEGPGSRKAISNGKARGLISRSGSFY